MIKQPIYGVSCSKRSQRLSQGNAKLDKRASLPLPVARAAWGKTNLTVNLALALSELGQKVVVIDADLGMANVDVLLGTTPKHTLVQLLDADVPIQEILLEGPGGIRFLTWCFWFVSTC